MIYWLKKTEVFIGKCWGELGATGGLLTVVFDYLDTFTAIGKAIGVWAGALITLSALFVKCKEVINERKTKKRG